MPLILAGMASQMSLDPKHVDTLEIAGVLIGAVALMYMLLKPQNTAPATSVAMPVLLGSGSSGAIQGLSPAAPSTASGPVSDIQLPPMPTISFPGGNYNYNMPTIINTLTNPAGGSCCNQAPSAPYVAPAQAVSNPPAAPSTQQVQNAFPVSDYWAHIIDNAVAGGVLAKALAGRGQSYGSGAQSGYSILPAWAA